MHTTIWFFLADVDFFLLIVHSLLVGHFYAIYTVIKTVTASIETVGKIHFLEKDHMVVCMWF